MRVSSNKHIKRNFLFCLGKGRELPILIIKKTLKIEFQVLSYGNDYDDHLFGGLVGVVINI